MRALEARNGDLSLNTHVAEIVYDEAEGRCVGVKLKNGRFIRATKAVVSNATPFDTVKMLPDGGAHPSLPEGVRETHVSLFDGSNCGIRVDGRPVWSVQHHPESSPGPQDSFYLFQRFADLMAAHKA